jgi:hypothetical protein
LTVRGKKAAEKGSVEKIAAELYQGDRTSTTGRYIRHKQQSLMSL